VIGDSNAPCFNTTSTATVGAVGSTCTLNSDCLYNTCTDQKCGVALLTCPTNLRVTICSGHGDCEYSDPSGVILQSCTVLNNTCTAACVCGTGFGGADCSLGAAEIALKDSVRTALCQAIVDSSLIQDKSTGLLITLTNSLLSSFNSAEVISPQGQAVCAKALDVISALSSSGLLAGDKTLSILVADVISRYI
jgi:hypothetical protein